MTSRKADEERWLAEDVDRYLHAASPLEGRSFREITDTAAANGDQWAVRIVAAAEGKPQR